MNTGEIEVKGKKLYLLNQAVDLPFPVLFGHLTKLYSVPRKTPQRWNSIQIPTSHAPPPWVSRRDSFSLRVSPFPPSFSPLPSLHRGRNSSPHSILPRSRHFRSSQSRERTSSTFLRLWFRAAVLHWANLPSNTSRYWWPAESIGTSRSRVAFGMKAGGKIGSWSSRSWTSKWRTSLLSL